MWLSVIVPLFCCRFWTPHRAWEVLPKFRTDTNMLLFFKFLEPTLNLVSHMQSLLFCAGAIGGVERCSWHTSSSGHTSVAVGPVEWPSTIEVDGLVLVMLICEWWHLWRHLDDICGLCDTCGQLVMIFVMVMDYM